MASLPTKIVHEDNPDLTEWGYRMHLINLTRELMKIFQSQRKPRTTEELEKVYLSIAEILESD